MLLYVTRLVELGEIARAVSEADACLAMPSEVRAIARLLDARGHHAEALQGAAPGLYQAAERIAGADWDAVKRDLLDNLQQVGAYTEVDIYLYAHMLVEAMRSADKRGDYSADLERVIEAVRGGYPDWGIRHCKRRAERIMHAGDAKRYQGAAAWLRSARIIYAQHGRLAEWHPYLAELLEIHQRKYKLVPLLTALHA